VLELVARDNASSIELSEARAFGVWFLWFAEKECRQRRGEVSNRRGWPSGLEVKSSMLKLFTNLEPAAQRMQALMKEAAKALETKPDDAASSSSAAVDGELKAMASIAATGMTAGTKAFAADFCMDVEKDTVESWAEGMLEFLLPAHKAEVEKVRSTGVGICSSCRWTSGCHRCLWWKAVRYRRNKEVGGVFMEGYADSSKAKVKVKAKASLKGGGSLDVSFEKTLSCHGVPLKRMSPRRPKLLTTAVTYVAN